MSHNLWLITFENPILSEDSPRWSTTFTKTSISTPDGWTDILEWFSKSYYRFIGLQTLTLTQPIRDGYERLIIRLRTCLDPNLAQLQFCHHRRNCFLEWIRRLMVPSSRGQCYDFARETESNLVTVFWNIEIQLNMSHIIWVMLVEMSDIIWITVDKNP